jgi:hypothetical protein
LNYFLHIFFCNHWIKLWNSPKILLSHLALRILLFCNRHCREDCSFGSTCKIYFYSRFISPD